MARGRYAHLQHLALVESQRTYPTVSSNHIISLYYRELIHIFVHKMLIFYHFRYYFLQRNRDLKYYKLMWNVNRWRSMCRWDYIQVGNKLYKDMDRVAAFEKALETWAGWVDSNVDPTKTRVFFQGISPSHYK